MSTYKRLTKHPVTNEWEHATWHDDYFGSHEYGVEFPSGEIFDPRYTKLETKNEDPHKCEENMPLFVDTEGLTGVAYGDTHNFELKEEFQANLQVIKCKDCGRESISWERVK